MFFILDNQRGILTYQIRQLHCRVRGARAHNLFSKKTRCYCCFVMLLLFCDVIVLLYASVVLLCYCCFVMILLFCDDIVVLWCYCCFVKLLLFCDDIVVLWWYYCFVMILLFCSICDTIVLLFNVHFSPEYIEDFLKTNLNSCFVVFSPFFYHLFGFCSICLNLILVWFIYIVL